MTVGGTMNADMMRDGAMGVASHGSDMGLGAISNGMIVDAEMSNNMMSRDVMEGSMMGRGIPGGGKVGGVMNASANMDGDMWHGGWEMTCDEMSCGMMGCGQMGCGMMGAGD